MQTFAQSAANWRSMGNNKMISSEAEGVFAGTTGLQNKSVKARFLVFKISTV